MAENGSVVIKIKGDDNDFKSKLKSLGSTVSTTMKATAAAVGTASAGIAALGTACINAYADYEQLVGGVETLFKDSADLVQSYADNAYKTAGLSANAYMETVTSFSASLLQSLGGDTEAAAKAADRAIIDMADNANKMGTSMELIQNAYQGFAKQNYTMLDNLKLGYGGTKEEMQRLLQDAEKLSGIKYDISSFADITEAIHVIQTEMGITGTTALEASTTIQGSIASMKASWTNLMVGMADDTLNFDALLSNFIESVGTVAENLLPRISVVVEGMGKLVAGLAPEIAAALPTLTNELLPNLVELGVQAVGSLVQGIQENSDSLAEGALSIISTLGSGIVELIPMIADTAASLIVSLADGITESLPEMVPAAVETIAALVENLTSNADTILQAGIDIILALGQGIINAIPQLIENIPEIVINIANVINDNAPRLLDAALYIITRFAAGLIQNIPVLVSNIPKIIEAIVSAFMAFQWLNLGKQLITGIKNGITSMGESMKTAAKDTFAKFKEKFGLNEFKTELKNIGKNIIDGIINGIKSGFKDLGQAAINLKDTLLSKLKGAFSIHSPSQLMKEEVGQMIGEGIAAGIAESGESVINAAENLSDDILYQMDSLQNKLSNYGDLFHFAETDSGKALKLDNLQDDVDALYQYKEALMQIKSIGISDDLMGEIVSMDPDEALQYMEELLSMTEDDLNEYISLYEEKQKAAEEIAREFYNVGAEVSEGMNEASAAGISAGMEEQEATVVENTQKLAEAAKEELAGYKDDFQTIGESLMDGVAKGIRDGQSGVVNAIARALKAAVRAAREEMDINSPSRVMAEIGDYMAQGIGVGWSDRMETVTDTIGNSLSDGLERKMSNAYEKMRAAMNQNMFRLRGDIAVQSGGSVSYNTSTKINKEGDTVLHIEHFHNDSKEAIPSVMQEMEFARRRKALAKGGE